MIFFEMFAFNGWLSPPPPPIPIGPVPLSTLSTLSTFEQPLTLLDIQPAKIDSVGDKVDKVDNLDSEVPKSLDRRSTAACRYCRSVTPRASIWFTSEVPQ
jgi:hypothetical protein